MKQPRTFLLLGVVVATLLLGIAYAAINNINFNISGKVTATPDQASFKVAFTKNHFYEGPGTAKVTYKNDNTATVSIDGFTTGETKGVLSLEIHNESDYPVYVRASDGDVSVDRMLVVDDIGSEINRVMNIYSWVRGFDGSTNRPDFEGGIVEGYGNVHILSSNDVNGEAHELDYAILVVEFYIPEGYKNSIMFDFDISFEASPYELEGYY